MGRQMFTASTSGRAHISRRSVTSATSSPNSAALDSAAARALLGPGDRAGDTLVVTVAGRVCTRSEAVLELARRLPAPWAWLAAARILPRGLRDGGYDLVARNRHRWRRDPGCLVRPPDLARRFLD